MHVYAQLRVDSEAAGHAPAQGEHNADRWIAATAVNIPSLKAQVAPRQHPARHPDIRIRATSHLYLERARIPAMVLPSAG